MPRQNLKRLAQRIGEFSDKYQPQDASVEKDAIIQMAALRRLTIEQEEEMANNWIKTRDEKVFQDLITSMLSLQFRVVMGMKFSGDDWLDILHDAVVSALSAVSKMKTYDRGAIESSISLAVIEAQRRHLTRMGRGLNGPNRPAKTRAAAHLSTLASDLADDRDLHNIAMRSGISLEDLGQMQDWLAAEDTNETPQASDQGDSVAEIEVSLDIEQIRGIVPLALDTRSADIIQMRFLSEPQAERSDLAEKWDITETRVGQLERAACADLRRYLEGATDLVDKIPAKAATPIEVPAARTVLKPAPERPAPEPTVCYDEIEPQRRTHADMESALERMRARSKARGSAFSVEHFASFHSGQY